MSASNDRLEKRRAVNRQSQRRARAQKEEHIKDLERTNSVLEDEIKSLRERLRTFGNSAIGIFNASPSSSSGPQRSNSSGHSAPPSGTASSIPQHSSVFTAATSIEPSAASIDLEACRQAFVAVLASVCDPHLNTIHAVAQKFASSRNPRPTDEATKLNHPRPVNRPLNQYQNEQIPQTLIYDPFNQSQANHHQLAHLSQQQNFIHTRPDSFPDNFTAFISAAFPALPPASYVPEPDSGGPLWIPNFEAVHPVDGFELDADGVWSQVLLSVDMTKVDAEDLAGKLVEKIRCYGFGPVLMRQDVSHVCQNYPQLQMTR